MIRIEFLIPIPNEKGVVLWKDFALVKQAIVFYNQCKSLGLNPIAFDIVSKVVHLDELEAMLK